MATVVTAPQQGKSVEMWKSGICDCFDDCGSCWLGILCPCVLYGQNKSATTGEGCIGGCCVFWLIQGFAPFLLPCITSSNRTTIRQSFKLAPQVKRHHPLEEASWDHLVESILY